MVSKCSQLVRESDTVTERIVLQICTVTRKVTCRTFDTADSKAAARPAEWKFQSHVDRWLQLNTRLSFQLEFAIPNSQMSQTLTKQIQNGISPLCHDIRVAVATVDGKLLPGDSVLDNSPHQS